MVMNYARNLAVLVCLVQLAIVICVLGQNEDNSVCDTQQTCAECIQKSDCIWCREERAAPGNASSGSSKPRCVSKGSSMLTNTKKGSHWCQKEMIVDPPHEVVIIDDRPFSSVTDNQTQIKPQHVKIVLRRGETKTLKIQYKQAKDYPVDLYFLMDLSASMQGHKNNLSKLGVKLAEAMRRLTGNFTLGFGSFVDKVLLPMTNTQPEWLRRSCGLKKEKCAPPYGYKRQMQLTNNYMDFERQVQAAPISQNLDAPEGGLDAVMQAIVCWNETGWRKNARHILVYSSDDAYHIAGDGKLAGVIEPNDEKCHLNSAGFYTHAEKLDYPSISQINKQARENNIDIIFAVTEERRSIYEKLSAYINGSAVGTLDEKSDKVVSLVQQQYKKLTNTLIMSNSPTNLLEVRYYSRCLDQDRRKPPMERRECSGVRVDTVIEFDVTIKAVDCPQRPEDWRQRIEIKPQSVNERVIVDVEVICDCPCSRPDNENYEKNSKKCSESGDFTCGICACKEGFYGKQCDCPEDEDFKQDATLSLSCYRYGPTKSKKCSGHGRCNCGTCKCDAGPNPGDKFYGKYCHCDNFSCQRFNGQVCGGPSRGRCDCGNCICNSGLGGPGCDCSTVNSTCIPPGENAQMCSGFGECECGKCKCRTNEGRSGQFCEECPTCPTQRCDELKDCVECQAYKSGQEWEKGDDCASCDTIELEELVEDIDEDPKAVHDPGTHLCSMPDSSGCTFVFSYKSTRGDTSLAIVKAEKQKKCAEPVFSPLGVASGAIGLTLFLGLLGLLIWKLVTMFHDHREWVKFEKERISARWERGENPLFKAPTTSFKNPTFGGDQ